MSGSLQTQLSRLQSLVNWERGKRSNMRVDLQPVRDLLERLGSPQRQCRGVHVTGTKGKGSVCSLVEAGLRAAGLRTGLYASPHVHVLNERIRIQGRPIDDDAFATSLCAVMDARDAALAAGTPGAMASWFDVMTACAFQAFAQAGVGWAAVEVGMGGRLDSTNAWTGDVAVVTNIGLEHTEVLGGTVEAIAAEKAGIVKQGTLLVTPLSPSSPAGRVLMSCAAERHVTVRRVALTSEATPTELNIAVAQEVLDTLGALGLLSRTRRMPVGRGDLDEAAIRGAALPGRMQRMTAVCPRTGRPLPVILDGAHVDFALAGVLAELERDPRLRAGPVVLMALGADKQPAAMLNVLRRRATSVVFVPLEGGQPCWAPWRLVEMARELGLSASSALTARRGLDLCLQLAFGRWVLATGSLHLVGTVERLLMPATAPSLASH